MRPTEVSFVGWITAGHVVIHWYQQLFPVVTPTLKSALGLNEVEVGVLGSARTLSGGLLTLPVGMASDAQPRSRIVMLAGAIAAMGAGFTIAGILPSYAWIVIASLLIGTGTALWHPTALAAISLRYPARRGTMLSIHGTGATVGDTFTPIIAGALLAAFAWQPVLAVQIVPALLFGALLVRFFGPSLAPIASLQGDATDLAGRLRGVAGLLRNGPFVVLTLAAAAWGIGRLVVLTFLPIYLQEDLGYSTVELGFYLALLHALGIVSQTILGLLSDRFGRKTVLVPSFAILGVLYVALAYAPAGIALGAVVAAIGIFFYTLANIVTAATFDVVEPDAQASATGLQGIISQVVTIPSTVIAGAIILERGTAPVFVLCGVVVLVAAALMLVTAMRRTPAPAPV